MNIICKQWTEDFEVYDYHIEDILSLIKKAYGERAKEGIQFATLSYSIDDFLAERADSDYWFLAFDERKKLYGTARLTIDTIKNNGEICNFAVSPDSQGKHVGSLLLQEVNSFAKKYRLDHLLSYTAVRATSSVKCHKKNGYIAYGIIPDRNRGYSSYMFKNQISNSTCLNTFFIRFHFLLSFIKNNMLRRKID